MSYTNPTPQKPLQAKAYHMWAVSSISVTCNNDHTTIISPTNCEKFHRKWRGERRKNESVSWSDGNIKLLHVEMAMKVLAYEVTTLLGIQNLTNANICKALISKY